jgi:hypothetical protein
MARSDLDGLKSSIAGNLARLDAEALTMAQAIAVAPFAPTIVRLVEARMRVEEMNAQRAAGTATDITREIARLMAAPPRVNREQATLGATAVDQLRAITTEWFTFYNGYDPLFTWWMGMPYAKLDESLGSYAALLRDTVAAENLQVPATPATADPIAPTAPLKFADVPDLAEIIALPHDEMRDIVARFTGAGAGSRGGGGRGMPSGPPRDVAFYTSWLAASTRCRGMRRSTTCSSAAPPRRRSRGRT